MSITNKTVDINNPADWNRFAPDELVKTSQLAEFFGVAPHIILNNRDIMPKAHIMGKPVLYLGSEITRWLNIPDNRDMLKKYQKSIAVDNSKELEAVDILSTIKPKLNISYSNDTVTITVSRNEFRTSGLFSFLQRFA